MSADTVKFDPLPKSNAPPDPLTRTSWFVPLYASACGFGAISVDPLAVHVGPFCSMPVCPFPEESAVVVPLPSSNFQKPRRLLLLTVGAHRLLDVLELDTDDEVSDALLDEDVLLVDEELEDGLTPLGSKS